MAKKTKHTRPEIPELGKKEYERALRRLQIELVKLHHHVIAHDLKILVILEGRDSAGKDGTIKRIVEHLSPREARVVAPGKPSDREETEWYFQRYVRYLPAAQEIVLFNRSWYNRAGVEPVMNFCTRSSTRLSSGRSRTSSGSWCARAPSFSSITSTSATTNRRCGCANAGRTR